MLCKALQQLQIDLNEFLSTQGTTAHAAYTCREACQADVMPGWKNVAHAVSTLCGHPTQGLHPAMRARQAHGLQTNDKRQKVTQVEMRVLCVSLCVLCVQGRRGVDPTPEALKTLDKDNSFCTVKKRSEGPLRKELTAANDCLLRFERRLRNTGRQV